MMNRFGGGGSNGKSLKNSRLSLPIYFPSSPKQERPGSKKVDGTSTYDMWGTPRLFAWDPTVSDYEQPLSPVDSEADEKLSPTVEEPNSPQVIAPAVGIARSVSPFAEPSSGSRSSSGHMKKMKRTDSVMIDDMKFTNDVLAVMGLEPLGSKETSPPPIAAAISSTAIMPQVVISGTASLGRAMPLKIINSSTINSQGGVAEVAFFAQTLPTTPSFKYPPHNVRARQEGAEAEDEFADEFHGSTSKGLKKHDSLSNNSDFESGELIVESDSTLEPNTSFSSNSDVSRSKSEEFCQHFLKGKCRFRDRCRNSHNVINCIYCNELLPVNRVAASAHLHHCWRLSQKGAVSIIKA
eukprot:TRINITY_DN185_c0_g1_i1.p1 TRINITY_DN185_c0_g1~~TRINITY_DN185_c0_g1_i1.p1  ORF type:complete len:352 (+),score=84.34 TRINITY_DN185_c0_g1_i1:199-1254(+)